MWGFMTTNRTRATGASAAALATAGEVVSIVTPCRAPCATATGATCTVAISPPQLTPVTPTTGCAAVAFRLATT